MRRASPEAGAGGRLCTSSRPLLFEAVYFLLFFSLLITPSPDISIGPRSWKHQRHLHCLIAFVNMTA
jgi:hypothetical protein